MPDTTTAPTTPTMAPPSARAQFLESYTREHATTMKVLNAFPADQCEMQPHAKSSTARRLAWTFVIEEGGMVGVLKNTFAPPKGGFPPPPDSWQTILDMFAGQSAEVVSLLESMSDDDLVGSVPFFTAPGQVGPVPRAQLLWFLLSDQIHHRGQLSVYLRMAGGKVPSIYGPTADEPWF